MLFSFPLGGSPFPGVQLDERFIDLLKDGYRMAQPEHASEEMWVSFEFIMFYFFFN